MERWLDAESIGRQRGKDENHWRSVGQRIFAAQQLYALVRVNHAQLDCILQFRGCKDHTHQVMLPPQNQPQLVNRGVPPG